MKTISSSFKQIGSVLLVRLNLSIILSAFLLMVLSSASFAQDAKKAAEVKKFETALNTAKANLAKAEKQLALSDSLLQTGQTMVTEGKSETKSAGVDRKKLDKQYATNRKPLDKQSGSKDKEEAAQAKKDLKELDTQYKKDAKDNDNQVKLATKKMTTGEANMSKGKAGKKTAEAAVETAQAAVDAAQEKYDTATGVAPAEDEGGKKKKKK